MKKTLITVFVIILYLFSGVILSYRRQPEISEEYINEYNTESFYSEDVSIDRAYIVEDNIEALLSRLQMIETAEETIILSTFEFKSDNSGKDILGSLLNAAERGVDIKILIDGISADLQLRKNEYFMALSTMDNVEIRVYNYINPIKPWKSMGRLHDKYLIVDYDLYILGGRNTYDIFLGDNDYQNIDRDLFVYNTESHNTESSIYKLIEYFEEIWNYKECKVYKNKIEMTNKRKIKKAKDELKNIYIENLSKYPQLSKEIDYTNLTYETNRISLIYNPIHVYSKEPTAFYSLVKLMKKAKEEVKIHTPYIVCNDMMYDSLTSISNGSAKVSVMTNSVANNGNPFGASDYFLNKDKILETGIEIYEYEGGTSYHGKSITIDNNIAIIGSFNIDMRSVYLSTEIMLVVDSEEVNKQLKEYMNEYEEESVHVVDKNNEVVAEGLVRQELKGRRKLRVFIISLFNVFRFLY